MARGRVNNGTEDAEELARFGLEGIHGYRASLFPHGRQREQRLTSRLMATLEICRPFAQAFFAYLEVKGPTQARRNTGTYGAHALVEPTFTIAGEGGHGRPRTVRADGAVSFRKGSQQPWRCAFEVKYLQEGRGDSTKPALLTAAQVGATFTAAHAAGFQHVVTVSAAEWDWHHHPSGYRPDGRKARRTGLSHISWLGVLRVLRTTQLEHAGELSPVEHRLLADFERYLTTSDVWTASRLMTLGSSFTRVRDACRAGASGRSRALSMEDVGEVADRWVRLTEVVSHILSIETGHDVLVDSTRRTRVLRTERADRAIRQDGALEATFSLRECLLGTAVVHLDLRADGASVEWSIDADDLTRSPNARSATRWDAFAELLVDPRLVQTGRRFTVWDTGRAPIIDAQPLKRAAALIDAARAGDGRPQRLVIAYADTRSRLKSNTIAPVIENLVRTTTPW